MVRANAGLSGGCEYDEKEQVKALNPSQRLHTDSTAFARLVRLLVGIQHLGPRARKEVERFYNLH